MKLKMSKTVPDLKCFMVVNYPEMLFAEYDKEINVIILNDTDTQELIEVFKNTSAKSKQYLYILCMANNKESIQGLAKLILYLHFNDFRYYITSECLEMYKKKLNEDEKEITTC